MLTPDEQKRDATRLLIFGGFVVGAIVVMCIIFIVVPYILMNRPDKSVDKDEVAPKRVFQQINLYIQSNVGGAEVYLKGEKGEWKGITASTDKKANFFNLRRGIYEIRLKREGYQEIVKQIEITGEKSLEKIRIDLTKASP